MEIDDLPSLGSSLLIYGVFMYFVPIEIGQWFKNRDSGQIFKVVAADEADDYVEIQYFSSEIEEMDLEEWQNLNLIPIPEPEDWSGPYELMREDVEFSDNPLHPENWSGALAGLEPEDLY